MEDTMEQQPLSMLRTLPEPIPNSDGRAAPGSAPNGVFQPGTAPFPGRDSSQTPERGDKTLLRHDSLRLHEAQSSPKNHRLQLQKKNANALHIEAVLLKHARRRNPYISKSQISIWASNSLTRKKIRQKMATRC